MSKWYGDTSDNIIGIPHSETPPEWKSSTPLPEHQLADLGNRNQGFVDGYRDYNKDVMLGEELSPVAKNNAAVDAEALPRYVNQKILLNPITFRFGKNETYTDTSLQNIRFYAFTYMDYEAFMSNRNIRTNSGTARIEKPLVSTGLGFVSPGIFKGEQNVFVKQEAVAAVTPPNVLRVASIAPLENIVQDRRQYGNL